MATTSRKNRLAKTKEPQEWQRLFKCIDTRYPTQARNHCLLWEWSTLSRVSVRKRSGRRTSL